MFRAWGLKLKLRVEESRVFWVKGVGVYKFLRFLCLRSCVVSWLRAWKLRLAPP